MDENSNLISAFDAIKLSTENGWDKTFSSAHHQQDGRPQKEERQSSSTGEFNLADAVKFCNGKTVQDGQIKGRVVKQTNFYVWIVCDSNIMKIYKKAKKNVQLLLLEKENVKDILLTQSVTSTKKKVEEGEEEEGKKPFDDSSNKKDHPLSRTLSNRSDGRPAIPVVERDIPPTDRTMNEEHQDDVLSKSLVGTRESPADHHATKNRDSESSLKDYVLINGRPKRKRDDEESTFQQVRKIYQSESIVEGETQLDLAVFTMNDTQEKHINDPQPTAAAAAELGSPLPLFRGHRYEDANMTIATTNNTTSSSLLDPNQDSSIVLLDDDKDKNNLRRTNKVIPPPPGFARLPTGKTPGRKKGATFPMKGNACAIKTNGPFSYGMSLQLENILLSSSSTRRHDSQQGGLL